MQAAAAVQRISNAVAARMRRCWLSSNPYKRAKDVKGWAKERTPVVYSVGTWELIIFISAAVWDSYLISTPK